MSRKRQTRPPPPISAESSPPQSSYHLVLRRLLLVGAPTIALLILAIDYLWVTEDAYITFQSVENLWAGYGPNFNRGLRVESFSHPLWFIILSVLRVGGGEALPLLSALTGIALSVAGLALAAEAARIRLADRASLAPFGAVAIAALPPFWQFASSGLETGLTFFWIGGCSWLLTTLDHGTPLVRKHAWWFIGLGPIIRPDLGAFSAVFLVAALLLTVERGASPIELIKRVAACALPATAWQVFRMGYYGAILPNTYLAKEGLGSRWDQGAIYLEDLTITYLLWPILYTGMAVAALSIFRSKTPEQSSMRSSRYSILTLWCGALIHGALVCRTGGDFMHARLLLPALFALLSSCAVLPLPRAGRTRGVAVTLFALWLGYVALLARPTYSGFIGPAGIADERQFYVRSARSARPVSLKDYEFHPFYRTGETATQTVRSNNLRAMYWGNIGIMVAMVPDDIIVIDPLALNDHIGSRIELTTRGRPGHEKIVPASWFLARYPPGVGFVVINRSFGLVPKKESPEDISLAKLTLQSPALRELTEAVSAPMTGALFARNLFRAWRLSFIKIPPKPADAFQKLVVPTLGIPKQLPAPAASIPSP